MYGILSIDFDYFVDASAQERDTYFLQGEDEMPRDTLYTLWQERYLKYPQLAQVGVIDHYFAVRDFLVLLELRKECIFRSDTHKKIKDVIDRIPRNLRLRIVNIDFHHDFYHYYMGGNYCNCGNWLRRVVEERPDTRVKWIRREDSQIHSLEGEFPFEHTTDLESVFAEKFDCTFICRSPEWSPPHLSDGFEAMVQSALTGESA